MENGFLVKQGSYSSLDLNEYFKMHETSFVKEDANNTEKGFFLIFYYKYSCFWLSLKKNGENAIKKNTVYLFK